MRRPNATAVCGCCLWLPYADNPPLLLEPFLIHSFMHRMWIVYSWSERLPVVQKMVTRSSIDGYPVFKCNVQSSRLGSAGEAFAIAAPVALQVCSSSPAPQLATINL